MDNGFRPFDGQGQVSSFWDVKEARHDPLVIDQWRHRQVPCMGVGAPGPEHSIAGLRPFDNARSDYGMPAPTYGQVPGKASAGERSLLGQSSSTGSTAVSLGDLHLSTGTGYAGLPLETSANSALYPQRTVAEMSERRKDAIRSAFRRIDVKGQGWVTTQDLAMALQRFSNLSPPEQERLKSGLGSSGTNLSQSGTSWGSTHVSFAAFAGYYQLLGSSIERDRDFEDVMRHHWGFAEISNILEDMKNKFAMVGLAYALRNSLAAGGSQEMSLESFQEAISHVGMHYNSNDVCRLFDAFNPNGHSSDKKCLEVLRLTQHLTSAPRPSTPIPVMHGTAHFSEVNSQAELGDMTHQLALMGNQQSPTGHQASPFMAASLRHPAGMIPPTVPAPPETTPGQLHPPTVLAPPEDDDDGGAQAPPEGGGKQREMPVFRAPPEDDDGDLPPDEDQEQDGMPTQAPEERDLSGHHMGHHMGYHTGHHTGHHMGGHHMGGNHMGGNHMGGNHVGGNHVGGNHMGGNHMGGNHMGSHMEPAPAPHSSYGASGPPASMPAPHSSYGASGPPAVAQAAGPAGRKRAVTIGINYVGQQCQLAGCINDSDTFISLLTEEFKYNVTDIRQLRDDHPQRMPSRKNIAAAMQWLVNGAREGDHLFFHYSGHGSQQNDRDGDEMDGHDETLVPCDYQHHGMLSDDELRRVLVTSLPKGVRLTVILDCCHSGSALDLPYKASMKGDNIVDMKKKLPHKMPRLSEADVVMLSGCKDNQTSADIGAGSAGNSKAAGAMTTAFKTVITKYKDGSYHRVLSEIRRLLAYKHFKQVPQLSSEHFLNLTECFMPEARPVEVGPEAPLRPPVRKALTIGINYLSLRPGQGQLAGCINDSDTMMGVLREVFHFSDSQICRLRDDRPDMMPTKANILASFRWLTQGAGPGDELFLHYSGHGGQQRDTNGDEQSGKDDTLIPCDFQAAGQITDDELRHHIVEQLPKGCRMYVIFDCCHSGTALDLRFKVQCSPDGHSMHFSKTRGSRRGYGGAEPSKAEVIMISGCKDDQTSADVQAGSMGAAKAAGAMTTAFRHVINPNISCHDLLVQMRRFLKHNHFKQIPQMSSEQFVQLDSGYVGYGAGGKHTKPPMPVSPSHGMGAHVRSAMSPTPGAMPIRTMSPTPAALPMQHMDPEKYVMDSRINQLEEQIAKLRKQQESPAPGMYDMGARLNQPSPMQTMGSQYPQSPSGMHVSYGSPPMYGMHGY